MTGCEVSTSILRTLLIQWIRLIVRKLYFGVILFLLVHLDKLSSYYPFVQQFIFLVLGKALMWAVYLVADVVSPGSLQIFIHIEVGDR